MWNQRPSTEMKPLIMTLVIVKIFHCGFKGKESASYFKSLYRLKVAISSFILGYVSWLFKNIIIIIIIILYFFSCFLTSFMPLLHWDSWLSDVMCYEFCRSRHVAKAILTENVALVVWHRVLEVGERVLRISVCLSLLSRWAGLLVHKLSRSCSLLPSEVLATPV